MSELNLRGKDFINDWNKEIHSTTKRIPNEYFENEEVKALLPLPNKRFRIKVLEKRVVSNDSLIHINSNKYSVPVKYATKQIQYKIVYGYRIDLYTIESEYIMSLERQEGKHNTFKNIEHYEAIAVKANKSIPQIKRDFTAIFKNGEEYLKAASNLFQQPSYHARKILELLDLYEPEVLDKILSYAIKHEKLDIKSLKLLIKNNFFDIISENKEAAITIDVTDIEGITRNCDYYDKIKEVTSI